MTGTIPRKALTLGVYPTAKGFGWAIFEGPFAPYDWGIVRITKNKNSKCLELVDALIVRHIPDTLVLESFEPGQTRRTSRIVALGKALIAVANNRGIDVAVFSRSDIKACFATVGASSRQEIAEYIARHIETFSHRLPSKRKRWETEDHRMALFSAVALVLTHYHLGARRLFDELATPRSHTDDKNLD